MSHYNIRVCAHCRSSHLFHFKDVEDDAFRYGFYFHWVGNFYDIDVLLMFEDAVIPLFGERWVLGKEHERERVRR